MPGRVEGNMGKAVVHFEIASGNAVAANEFYRKLFGWKIDANNPMQYGIVDTGRSPGIGINGGIVQASDQMPPGVLIYIAVEDTDAYLKKVEALGGKIIHPTEVIPNMVTFALFSDPAGTVMGLVKDEPPAEQAPPKAAKPMQKSTSKKGAAKKKAKTPSKKSAKKKAAKKRR